MSEDEFIKQIRRNILKTMGMEKDQVIAELGNQIEILIEGYKVQQVEIDMGHSALSDAHNQIRELQGIMAAHPPTKHSPSKQEDK